MLTHLAFLKRYYSLSGNHEGTDLEKFEKDIFGLPLMKKYRLKYFMKTNMPVVHDFIVKRKRKRNLKKL